jgi:hypothetical protein
MANKIVIEIYDIEKVSMSVFAHSVAKALDTFLQLKNESLIKDNELLQHQIFLFSDYLEGRGAEMRDVSEMLDLYKAHFNIYDKRPSTQ